MKLHRFYTGNKFELTHEFWMDDAELLHQWSRVLRLAPGDQLVCYDNNHVVRQYAIDRYGSNAVKLTLVTEVEPQLPSRELYLCFSLLKKDKNEWVLQKGTELGVRHFVPLLCERTEKMGFSHDRALKIVTEASEQCGRADVPAVREPIALPTLIAELSGKATLMVAEQGAASVYDLPPDGTDACAVLIGPEGGWTAAEKQSFSDNSIAPIALSTFTLRAETAAITAVALLQLT